MRVPTRERSGSLNDYNLRGLWAGALASALLLGLFVVWRGLSLETLDAWVVEDGPLENATALFYGAA